LDCLERERDDKITAWFKVVSGISALNEALCGSHIIGS
jgi:hypothetical protein